MADIPTPPKKKTSHADKTGTHLVVADIHSDEPHEEISARRAALYNKPLASLGGDAKRSGLFDVEKASRDGAVDAGTIVVDKKNQRPTFGQSLVLAFREWSESIGHPIKSTPPQKTSHTTLPTAPVKKSASPVSTSSVPIPPLKKTDVPILEKAASTDTTRHVVIQKIRTLKQDIARIQGNVPESLDPVIVTPPSLTRTLPEIHVEPEITASPVVPTAVSQIPERPPQLKIISPDRRASVVAPVILAHSEVTPPLPSPPPDIHVATHAVSVPTVQISSAVLKEKEVHTPIWTHVTAEESVMPESSDHIESFGPIQKEEHIKARQTLMPLGQASLYAPLESIRPEDTTPEIHRSEMVVAAPVVTPTPTVPRAVPQTPPAPAPVPVPAPQVIPKERTPQPVVPSKITQQQARPQIAVVPETTQVLPIVKQAIPKVEVIPALPKEPTEAPKAIFDAPLRSPTPPVINSAIEQEKLEPVVPQAFDRFRAPAVGHETPVAKLPSFPIMKLVFITVPVIIIMAGGVVYYQFSGNDNSPTTAEEDWEMPIDENGSANINALVLATTKEAAIIQIQAEIQNAGPGYIPLVFVHTESTRINAAEFLSIIDAGLSQRSVRALRPQFEVGSITTTQNNPYIILESSNFELLFAGMLEWEKTMHADLAPLFGSAATTKESSFIDAVRGNSSTRILNNADGTEAMVYSFINKETVVITTTSDALAKILESRKR